MNLPKRYNPRTIEPQIQAFWAEHGVYDFEEGAEKQVYAIDTPPATVSGKLHLGHTYSYSQTDFMARFWRMNGYNVYYPMGYDDNGLPTERLVERLQGIDAAQVGREAFIQQCLSVSQEAETEYEALWKRLALSVDWRYRYRTIEARSRRISQLSFLDLYEKGLIYRRRAPAIWCPECGTAIAQAELDDLDRESVFYTLSFGLENGEPLPIATTRPELLPACVAVFVHPKDERYHGLVGQQVRVPLFGQSVPLLKDRGADPSKGTGAVMCCTFGDVADVGWWHTHHLPLVEAIDATGRMTEAAGAFAGLSTRQAREKIVAALRDQDLLLEQESIGQSVRVHERCDTPVEYIMTQQWFIRVLDFREQLIEAGEQIAWHPPHMKARYRQWVENLGWDWCISRQRAFGVPFPLWTCQECGEVMLATPGQLPIDPAEDTPSRPCACGSRAFIPEHDVMDTWNTSSLTPQIAGRWSETDGLYEQVFPMTLRPQAHDIIRTWAFYTIVKSFHHFQTLPWSDIAISGWGIAGEGMGKISKSRGGGPMPPMDMIDRYSADAVRYWAASTSLGKDAVISEKKIQVGVKLVNKLWNVARFSQRFLEGGQPSLTESLQAALSPADRWILSRTQRLVQRVTHAMRSYEYAAAKSEIETFFWTELADNYLEMAKLRLYEKGKGKNDLTEAGLAARYTLYQVLITVTKLFAPFMPHVTERIYQGLFATDKRDSIHRSNWPTTDPRLEDGASEAIGEKLVQIATAVRRYKSEHNLSLGTELERLCLAVLPTQVEALQEARDDLRSITRAKSVWVGERLEDQGQTIWTDEGLSVAVTV